MIGDIIASARTTHSFALLCDGSPVPSGSDYDILRSIVGNVLPDLRNMTLRGNRAGRELLSFEADGNKAHTHEIQFVKWNAQYNAPTYRRGSGYTSQSCYDVAGQYPIADLVNLPSGNLEVTVKNKSVNFFIIYKEELISMDMTKIDEIYNFTQLLKQNLFNQDCSKFLPYGTGLYASDDIKQISNMVFEKEDN